MAVFSSSFELFLAGGRKRPGERERETDRAGEKIICKKLGSTFQKGFLNSCTDPLRALLFIDFWVNSGRAPAARMQRCAGGRTLSFRIGRGTSIFKNSLVAKGSSCLGLGIQFPKTAELGLLNFIQAANPCRARVQSLMRCRYR